MTLSLLSWKTFREILTQHTWSWKIRKKELKKNSRTHDKAKNAKNFCRMMLFIIHFFKFIPKNFYVHFERVEEKFSIIFG